MKKFLYKFSCLLLIIFALPVSAGCKLTYDEYNAYGIKSAYIVGEYIFNKDSGFSPSIEDLATASRSIPTNQKEYIYDVLSFPNAFRYKSIFDGTSLSGKENFPDIYVSYIYKNHIATATDSDITYITCETSDITVKAISLATVGNGNYYTSATRYFEIDSTNGISKAYYCLTTNDSCTPNVEASIDTKTNTFSVNYDPKLLTSPSNTEKVCAYATDSSGNSSSVYCDENGIRVDDSSPVVTASTKFTSMPQGSKDYSVSDLFNISYGLSGKGKEPKYYYEVNGNKAVLSDLSVLPVGDVTVSVKATGGNLNTTSLERTIHVSGEKVKYDYKTNGGTSASTDEAEVIYNGLADLTPTATKNGYEFVGWNTDPNATEAIDYVIVNSNIILYAIYKKDITATYEIHSEGESVGSLDTNSYSCTLYNKDSKCRVDVPTFVPNSLYSFIGWNTNKNSIVNKLIYEENKTGNEDDSYYIIDDDNKINISDNITFYSITKRKNSLTGTFYYDYNDNGSQSTTLSCDLYNGSSSCTLDSQDINKIKVNKTIGTYVGYSNDDASISPVSDFTLTSDSKKVFYAYYDYTFNVNFISGLPSEANTNQVSVNTNAIITKSGISIFNSNITVPDANSIDGYTFDGYSVSSADNTVTYKVGDTITLNKTMTLYTIYSKDVTLSYDHSENGDDSEKLPSSVTKKIYINSGNTTISEVDFTTDNGSNYSFDSNVVSKWKDEETDTYYELGAHIKTSSDITLIPIVTSNSLNIIFDYKTNGGDSASIEKYVYLAGSGDYDFSNVTASKEGYEFVGWNTNKDATEGLKSLIYRNSSSNLTNANDVTYYAIFKKDITITYVVLDRNHLKIKENGLTTASQVGTVYNNDTSYEFTLYDVTTSSENFTFIGYSIEENKTKANYMPGDKVTLISDLTLYTVSRGYQSLDAIIYYYDDGIKNTTKSCYLYNGTTSCSIDPEEISETTYDGSPYSGLSSTKDSITDTKTDNVTTSGTILYAYYATIVQGTFISGLSGEKTEVSTGFVGYIVSDTGFVKTDATLDILTPVSITNFTTIGWYDENGNEVSSGGTITTNNNFTYYGHYKKNITLSYVTLGGGSIGSSSYQVDYSSKNDISALTHTFTVTNSIPSKKGYTFKYWSTSRTDSDGSKHYTSGDSIDVVSDASLYAIYSLNKYKVTLDAGTNGGTINNSSTTTIDAPYNTPIDLSSYTATRDGYDFVGWSTTTDRSGLVTSYTQTTTDNNSKLYAIFSKTLTATFTNTDDNKDLGTLDSATASCTIYNNETSCYVYAPNYTANDGYTFVGYVDQAYINNELNTNFIATAGGLISISEDKTFYTLVRREDALNLTTYSIDADSETSVRNILSCYLYNNQTSCNVGDFDPVSNRYGNSVFVGWSSSESEYTEYTGGSIISSDLTIYAYYKYTKNIYFHFGDYTRTSSTDDNGDDVYVYNTSETKTVTANEYYNATSTSSLRHTDEKITIIDGSYSDDNTFMGWTDDTSDFATVKYNVGDEINVADSLDLYAVNKVNVTFDSNYDESTDSNNKDVYVMSTYGELPTVTRTGYDFVGWFTDATDGDEITSNSDVTNNSNHTLYAHWNIKQYTITFNVNGGDDIASITQDYNSTLTLPTPNERYGYRFEGWYTDSEFANEFTKTTMPADNITLYAKWYKKIDVTLIFGSAVINGNNVTIPYTYNGDSEITLTNSNDSVASATLDTDNKQVIIDVKTIGEDTITLTASETDNYLGSSISKKITAGDGSTSNSTAFQTALSTWGTIGESDANWYGSTDDSHILDPDGTYVILESVNTNNFTGYYFVEHDADGNTVVPQYTDSVIDFDATSTDSDDDYLGLLVRFNPESTENYFSSYMFTLGIGDTSGVPTNAHNGILRANNTSFSETGLWSHGSTTLNNSSNVTELDINSNITWTRNKWEHYRLKVIGNEISVYKWDTNSTGEYEESDDVRVFHATDTSDDAIKSGTYGFWTFSQPYVQFKNFKTITTTGIYNITVE